MTTDFSELLRRLRLDAGFSQEGLAERAGISAKAISAYERGIRSIPRRETVALLVDALRLSGEARREFEETAAPRRAPTSENGSHHHLPWQATSFVGRQREVEDISGLLTERGLVTITGSGGIGKTRTTLEIALNLKPQRDGTWFVDLAPIGDPAAVVRKVWAALDLSIPEQGDPLEALVATIKDRAMLLILDNCEHVIDAVRPIARAILCGCPHVTILATSRERLGVAGEHIYPLSGLPMPAALELFAERAADAKHGFVLYGERVEAAADICRRLDGIALAIELAAARLPILGIAELQAQLKKHFRVIAGGRGDLPPRHQTLHATISWSHDLLDERERTLFRRLAIFAGGWTLEAAESVCAGGLLEERSVLDALFSLVEKSLVLVDLDANTPRYSFFESTRAYALEQLSADTERPALLQRHAQWAATMADNALDMLYMMPRLRWETTVSPELDNTLAALEWAIGADGDIVLAGRIASGFQGFWQCMGIAPYGQRYVTESLKRIDADEHPVLVAALLLALSRFCHGKDSVAAMERAIALLESARVRSTLASCYLSLANALLQTTQYADAERAGDKALELLREDGLQQSLNYASVLRNRSEALHMQGRFDEARTDLAEALSIAIYNGCDWSIALAHAVLAGVEFAVGDAARAVALGEQALASARRVRGPYQLSTLCNLACYQLVLGDIDAAKKSSLEALDLARIANDALALSTAIQHLATVASLRRQPSRAARLLGYVNTLYERMRCQRDPIDQKGYDILMTSLREQLTDDDITAHTVQGAQLTEVKVVDEALALAIAI